MGNAFLCRAARPAPALIIGLTSAILILGVFPAADWVATGDERALRLFFDYAGALWLIALTLAELGLCLLARAQFSRGEPLRKVWSLVSLSAAAHAAGSILSQALGTSTGLNPFAGDTGWPREAVRQWGLTIGGPLQMTFLAPALALALKTYRRSGLLPRIRPTDWILLSVVGGFAVWQIYEVVIYWGPNKIVDIHEAITVITDPLLCLLLAEAILIRRSVLNMGWGLIGLCWSAFTAAIFLTSVGNIGLWLTTNIALPKALVASTWYVWFLVYAAYALAPAYQVEACRRAVRPLVMPLKPVLWGRLRRPAA
ncbi:MAG: hypothetical protein ACM3S5_19290 [Rhodospirillales bacterium]